jgi:hypothetical protein
MDKKDFLAFYDTLVKEMRETLVQKNHDYTNDNATSTFANFEAVEILGIKTEQGMLTRMLDKFMRVKTIVSGKNLKVKDESARDTLKDLANYSILLAGYLHNKKKD